MLNLNYMGEIGRYIYGRAVQVDLQKKAAVSSKYIGQIRNAADAEKNARPCPCIRAEHCAWTKATFDPAHWGGGIHFRGLSVSQDWQVRVCVVAQNWLKISRGPVQFKPGDFLKARHHQISIHHSVWTIINVTIVCGAGCAVFC
jgi:hypothetical protein